MQKKSLIWKKPSTSLRCRKDLPGRIRWLALSSSRMGPSSAGDTTKSRRPPRGNSRAAGSRRRGPGASLYVTLEPCSHQGRTPPCTEALIAAGIVEVHVALADPNEKVDGLRRLQDAGIRVRLGLLGAAAFALNEVFITNTVKKRALVALKSAQSLDGRIALPDGASQWITGDAARQRGHRLRRRYGAVLVGVGTVIADDPLLNIRYGLSAPDGVPARIVLDSKLRIPEQARILNREYGPVFLYVADGYDREKAARLEERGIAVIPLSDGEGRVDLAALPFDLYRRGVGGVLVEGGGGVVTAFFRGRHWDKYHLFIAPKFLGTEGKPALALASPPEMAAAPALRLVQTEKIGGDVLLECEPKEGIRQCLPALLKKRGS